MDLAWEHGELSVKRARYLLGEGSSGAYTTVMTVLGNLSKKGLLIRTKEGRSYVYRPAMDKPSFLRGRIAVVTRCLRTNFGALLDSGLGAS